jgi:N-acetylmuramoyl-L-alanine amidase
MAAKPGCKAVCNINESYLEIVPVYLALSQNSVKPKTCSVILRKPSRGFLCYLSGMIRLTCLLPLFFTFITGAQLPKNNFLTGRTTGNMPSLEYGLGFDRLGAAKMTFLDTSVVVKVVDSTVGNYKVQLSKNHFAYLSKSNFKKDTTVKIQPYYLTASILASGDDKNDYVSISLDEKLPYRSIQQINPSRIVIDIFGASSNTNWVTQRSLAKEIRNVYYEQIEDDVYRVIIELNHEQHWGYSIYYQDKKLMVKIKRQPVDLDLEKMKIAVDAGHGGNNPGATGATTNIAEKNYTLLIAKELQRELQEEGAAVYMTREKDISLGMTERIDMIKAEDPDFLISIHLNSSVKDSVNGVSTYYRYIGFKPLTQFILNRMLELDLKEFGNVGGFNFALSGPTDYPNCLVEVAFLSNKEDERKIIEPQFHKDVAKKIVAGIKDWLKWCKKKEDD